MDYLSVNWSYILLFNLLWNPFIQYLVLVILFFNARFFPLIYFHSSLHGKIIHFGTQLPRKYLSGRQIISEPFLWFIPLWLVLLNWWTSYVRSPCTGSEDLTMKHSQRLYSKNVDTYSGRQRKAGMSRETKAWILPTLPVKPPKCNVHCPSTNYTIHMCFMTTPCLVIQPYLTLLCPLPRHHWIPFCFSNIFKVYSIMQTCAYSSLF